MSDAYTSYTKTFWSYVKSRKQEQSGIPPLKNKGGFLTSDSLNKAEILNEQFKSVFTSENLDNKPNKGPSPFTSMQNINVKMASPTFC